MCCGSRGDETERGRDTTTENDRVRGDRALQNNSSRGRCRPTRDLKSTVRSPFRQHHGFIRLNRNLPIPLWTQGFNLSAPPVRIFGQRSDTAHANSRPVNGSSEFCARCWKLSGGRVPGVIQVRQAPITSESHPCHLDDGTVYHVSVSCSRLALTIVPIPDRFNQPDGLLSATLRMMGQFNRVYNHRQPTVEAPPLAGTFPTVCC